MNRRHLLGTLTSAAALGVIARQTAAAEPEDKDKHSHGMQACLDACTDCMNECNITAHYCFEQTGKGTAKYLKALHMTVDCQEFCGTSAKLIGRASPLVFHGCHACAEACEMCAAECETFNGDEQMTKCATACRACAKSCRTMVEHSDHPATAHQAHDKNKK